MNSSWVLPLKFLFSPIERCLFLTPSAKNNFPGNRICPEWEIYSKKPDCAKEAVNEELNAKENAPCTNASGY